jgi:hypothetical protein
MSPKNARRVIQASSESIRSSSPALMEIERHNMAAKQVDAVATAHGLVINGYVFDKEMPLEHYLDLKQAKIPRVFP